MVAALMKVGVTMPPTVEPPKVQEWDKHALGLFGLSSVALGNDFSVIWPKFGYRVMSEAVHAVLAAKTAAARAVQAAKTEAARAEQAAKTAAARAVQAAKTEAARAEQADKLHEELEDFAEKLSKISSSETPGKGAAFHQELQRIIALDSPPDSGCKHQAAVYKQFRWMALLHEELFMGENIKGSQYKTFMQTSGMRQEDCVRGFHSIDWRDLSEDGDVDDAWLETWKHGVQRLRVKYCDAEQAQQQDKQSSVTRKGGKTRGSGAQRKHGKVVALCMYVPVLPTGLPQLKKDRFRQTGLLLKDGSPVTIKGQVVEMTPFVLTLPRFEFLCRLRLSATIHGDEGLQLTGVHGAGKTHTLEALSSVLLYGGTCDLLLHRSPGELLRGQDSLLAGVARCSGPLGIMLDNLDSGPKQRALVQACSTEPADMSSPSHALKKLKKEFDSFRAQGGDDEVAMFKALFAHMQSNVPEGQSRVIIMDEVNDLLKRVGNAVGRTRGWDKRSGADSLSADSVPAFLEAWVEWKLGAGQRTLRVLSSSPHGVRESVSDTSADPLFELRPPRADHLGALVALAPQYLLGTGQPPRSTPKQCEKTKAAVREAVSICDTLGSNMRYVSRYADSVSQGSPSAAPPVLHAMLVVLANRLRALLEEGTPERDDAHMIELDRSDSSPVWTTVLRDASLTVCRVQGERVSRLLAGKPSVLAACAALGSLARSGLARSELATALRHMAEKNFEEQCASRVYLNLMKRRWLAMPDGTGASRGLVSMASGNTGPIVTVETKVLRQDSSRNSADSSASENIDAVSRMHFLMSNSTSSYSVLQEPVVAACRKLFNTSEILTSTWQRATIQTVHQFPGVDVIEVERLGSTCFVRLYEVTRSTIARHAESKCALQYDTAVAASAGGSLDAAAGGKAISDSAKASFKIESVWGDVLALCGTPRHTAAVQRDGTVKMTRMSSLRREAALGGDPVGSLAKGTSLINTVLCSLGVPLVVRREIQVQGDDITRLNLSVEHSDVLCREMFGRGQDGDDAQWGMDGVTDWQLHVVYVSDTPQADNEADLLKHRSLVSAPFVRYVFKEQMQEVLPL